MKKNMNFQILRAIAAIFVCLNHFTIFNEYGFGACGVEIFFILSGYLTIAKFKELNRVENDYLIKKMIKVLPLYYIMTFVVFLVGIVKPSFFSSMIFDMKHLVSSVFLIPGNTFYVYQGWTLTYMFYFYAIFFVAYKCSKNYTETLVIVYILICTIIGIMLPDTSVFSLYNSPLMLEFCVGILCFQFIRRFKCYKLKKHIYYIFSIFLLLVLFFMPSSMMQYRYFIPSICTAVLVIIFNGIKLDKPKYKKLIEIGNISFTIYIIHSLIVRPFDKIIMNYNLHNNILIYTCIMFVIVIVIYISKVINTYIEIPITKRLTRIFRNYFIS